jgi:hypothetical protein
MTHTIPKSTTVTQYAAAVALCLSFNCLSEGATLVAGNYLHAEQIKTPDDDATREVRDAQAAAWKFLQLDKWGVFPLHAVSNVTVAGNALFVQFATTKALRHVSFNGDTFAEGIAISDPTIGAIRAALLDLADEGVTRVDGTVIG